MTQGKASPNKRKEVYSMCRYMVLVPGASEPLCERDNLADATNMAVRWKLQLGMAVVVVDNTTGEIMWGL